VQEIVLIGGGGHAKVLIEIIKLLKQYKIIGILDSQIAIGTYISGIAVLGKDDLMSNLYTNRVKNACIAVGSIKDNSKRKNLYEKVKQFGFQVPSLLHPYSIISKDTIISEGVQVTAGAIIQKGSTIGSNSIINTGAIIEHDCVIGKHVHVCPGVVISGDCVIGDSAFIGAGSVVIQGLKIGENSIVGAGAVVNSNVAGSNRVMGIPARIVNSDW